MTRCVCFLSMTSLRTIWWLHIARGTNASLLRGLRIGLGQRLSGWVAANRQSIRNSDAALDLGDAARSMRPRPRSCLSTPLLTGKNLAGVLTLYSTAQNAFTEEHQRLLEVVGRQVTESLMRASDVESASAPACSGSTGWATDGPVPSSAVGGTGTAADGGSCNSSQYPDLGGA